jgi:DNA-binding CsgD family transcriptional regulator/PAS domain-containing protein
VGDFREGWVGRDTEILPRDAVESTDYYRTLLEPHDFVKVVGLLLLKRPGEVAVAGVARGAADPDFEDDVVELMRLLCPHLTAAVRVFNRVGDLEHQVESLELALGQFAIGVALLDREGKVIFANAVAERQLAGRDGLVVRYQHLRSQSADETARLHAEIEGAIRGSEDGAHVPRLNVAAITRSAAGPLHVFAAPWMSQREVSLRRPAAVLLITEPGHRVPHETWLQALYGLTPAESRLAVLISGGMHGPEAACTLGLTAETVRSRLKTVFSKTNTRRQSDLARLLAGLPRG